MLVGALKKGKNIDGYFSILEPQSVVERHNALAEEMEIRGYTHKSPIEEPPSDSPIGIVNKRVSLKELSNRCPTCFSRYLMYNCLPRISGAWSKTPYKKAPYKIESKGIAQ